jgi:ADP-heptose:LPS heptosyltransferase
MKAKSLKVKNVLIVRPDALGDVILMIPMINTLKATYPKVKITVLLQKYAAPLLENHPNVDALIIDQKKEGRCNSTKDFISYAKEIRSEKFDSVIFSYLDGFYASLMCAAGIPIRIGDGQKLLIRLLLTHPVNQYFRQLAIHETEQNIRLLDALKSPLVLDTKMNLKCDSKSDNAIKLLLSEFKCNPKEYVIVHPATGGGNRAWSPEKYAKLINLIHKQTSLKVILTGFGAKEKEINKAIVNGCKIKPINCFERTSLQELMSLIKSAKVIVGTDTGPTHIAAALKVPVICISPTKFVKSLRWGPWETKSKILGEPQQCNLICNPYVCNKPTCLDSISEKKVCDALINLEDEVFSRSKMKRSWFLSSVNIAVVVSSQSEIEYLSSLMELYKQDSFRVNFLTNSSKIEKELKKIYSSVSCTRFSYLKMSSLIKLIATNDLNLIHLFPQKKVWIWALLIRQLAAPFMYCPPLVVKLEKLPKKASKLIDIYINAFSGKA